MAISSINMNRFDNDWTRRYLNNTQQFQTPYYSLNGDVSYYNNKVNANSSFTIAATEFSAAYDVNKTANTQHDYGRFVSIRPDNRNGNYLQSNSASNLEAYNKALQVSYQVDHGKFRPQFSTNNSQAVPGVPETYRDQISYYAINEANFDVLKNQAEFTIPRNGMGFRVFTDGAGNIDRIETDPSLQTRTNNPAATGENFALNNMTELTNGATFTSTPIAAREGEKTPFNLQNQNLNSLNAQELALQQTQRNGLNPASNVDAFENLIALGGTAQAAGLNQQGNDFLSRLARLQPQNQGLAIAGAESQVSRETALQIAAGQARYNVSTSQEFSQNLKQLQSNALQQGHLYGPAKADISGSIPMVAALPAPVKASNDGSVFTALNQQLGLDGSGALEDATAKKGGSGLGYMNFGASTSGEGSQGGNTGGSQSGGFGFGAQGGTSQQQEQQQQQRRRFMMNA